MKNTVLSTVLCLGLQLCGAAVFTIFVGCESSNLTAPADDRETPAVELESPGNLEALVQIEMEVDPSTGVIVARGTRPPAEAGGIALGVVPIPVTREYVASRSRCQGCNNRILDDQIISVDFLVHQGFVLQNITIQNQTCVDCTIVSARLQNVDPAGEGPRDRFSAVLDVDANRQHPFTVRFDLFANQYDGLLWIGCFGGGGFGPPTSIGRLVWTWNTNPLIDLTNGIFQIERRCSPAQPSQIGPFKTLGTPNDWHATISMTHPNFNPQVCQFSGTPLQFIVVCFFSGPPTSASVFLQQEGPGMRMIAVPIDGTCKLELDPGGGATLMGRAFTAGQNKTIKIDNLDDNKTNQFPGAVDVDANGDFTFLLSSGDVTQLQLTAGDAFLIEIDGENCGGTVQ
jgi:hypothetical protein